MTITITVWATTPITEAIAASTCHMIASFTALNPKLALGALLSLDYLLQHSDNVIVIGLINSIGLVL